ncbi:MAG: amino acid permease [Chitinophagales bacterium]|nr:amino acid permease [Chitinophagales bacterium]MDW8273969.1 amino acid permease [Chitinophagales bacterium]
MQRELFRKKSVEAALKDAASGYTDATHATGLKKALGVKDLTAMGIAAIVGAGIFSTIGKASFDGGPGIVLLFIFVAVACGFSALCYAEFASMVPVSGSAYTYSYVAFGEIIAWIIGWDLLMEYAIGNIAVSISWSDYFTTLLKGFNIIIPEYFTMDYWTAQKMETPEAIMAWKNAPQVLGIRLICDLPAFGIVTLITYITYIGIKESRNAANVMVLLKLAVIFLVVVVGAFYVKPENWSPFLPNGIAGVLRGTAAVFFAYIGFDAISTTAEEAKNPKRDLPLGMIFALLICTALYVSIALVITGMVNYKHLDVGDPLAFVFQQLNMDWLAGIVAISAVIATASVMLVFQVGQPRIWMAMSRDGLLPKIFSRIHPKYQTPSFSTLLTGLVVAIPALFLNMNFVIDLTSIGTLFAFVVVCGGILKLQSDPNRPPSSFKVPYINGRYILPLISAGIFAMWYKWSNFSFSEVDLSSWKELRGIIPYAFFIVIALITNILSFIKKLSLIPALGFLSCSYLLCESGVSNWERFLIWLVVGLVVYFLYGRKHSKLATQTH